VTVEAEHEIVRAAFRVGRCGYVLKREAPEDLMVGVETVLRVERYTSRTIAENWDR